MKTFNSIDDNEIEAAKRTIVNWPLSGYIGSDPFGGPIISELERDWKKAFGVKHAVAVNSATSGLLAACMAIGVSHGDEVICSPYTMSASAACPKLLGATIVWADIEPDTFTIDPLEVSNKITRNTKAVIATNLFGQPSKISELRDICDANGVWLIEDNAQAIFAREHNRMAGTVGHMGVFSLNVHKQLQVGEGGVIVTASDTMAQKLREAMNHGEMRGGILGLNLRMTEVTAAMAIEQLKKSTDIIESRAMIWHGLNEGIKARGIPIACPTIRKDCTHSYYAWAGQLKWEPHGVLPKPFKRGYMKPLYHLPAFRDQSWCETAESVEDKMVIFEVCGYDPTPTELNKLLDKLKEEV